MGNCIGKKADIHHKQRKYPSSGQRSTKSSSSFILASSSPVGRHRIFLSHLSDVKETNIIVNGNDENVKNVIQYSSPSYLATPTTLPSLTNEQLVSIHTSSILSPVQLSSECKKLKSSNTVIILSENNIKKPFTLMTNEQDITKGHLFSKENDINKENDNSNGNDKMNIDIKVHITDNDQSKNHQYFTIINEQNLSKRESIMVNSREIVQGKSFIS
jgi:hypothetical protein